MGIRTKSLLVAAVAAGYLAPQARAADVYYSDYAAWQAAVATAGLSVEALDFTAANLTFADEVSSAPGNNGGLGNVLNFQSTNTTLSRTFQLLGEQDPEGTSPADTTTNFVFNDTESGNLQFNNGVDGLSVGDVDNDENDDVILRFTSGGVFAAGLFITGNNPEDWTTSAFSSDQHTGEYAATYDSLSDDTYSVGTGGFDPGGPANGRSSITGASNMPSGSGSDAPAFIGVVGTSTFRMFQFDESTDADDIEVNGIRFAAEAAVIPEPSSLAALAILGTSVVARRRRRS